MTKVVPPTTMQLFSSLQPNLEEASIQCLETGSKRYKRLHDCASASLLTLLCDIGFVNAFYDSCPLRFLPAQ